MNGGQPGGLLNAIGLKAGVEKTDVFANAAGKQAVVLHHAARQAAHARRARGLHQVPADANAARRRRQQTQQQLEQRALATA